MKKNKRLKLTRRELHATYRFWWAASLLIIALGWIYGDTRAFNTIHDVRASYSEQMQAAHDRASLTAMIEAAEPELLSPPRY